MKTIKIIADDGYFDTKSNKKAAKRVKKIINQLKGKK